MAFRNFANVRKNVFLKECELHHVRNFHSVPSASLQNNMHAQFHPFMFHSWNYRYMIRAAVRTQFCRSSAKERRNKRFMVRVDSSASTSFRVSGSVQRPHRKWSSVLPAFGFSLRPPSYETRIMTHEEHLLHRLTQKSVNPKYYFVLKGMSVQIYYPWISTRQAMYV